MSALMLDKPIQTTKETLSFETPKALELVSFIGELREISADERMGMLESLDPNKLYCGTAGATSNPKYCNP